VHRVAIGLIAATLAVTTAWSAERNLIETPSLAPLVAAGKLPPVEQRVPESPLISRLDGPGKSLGKPGGELRTLIGGSKDTRLLVVYGYARLVGFNTKSEIEADILERFETRDDKVFTLHLRPGHRWSDGHPFTAEDFRYYWEDCANNADLSPIGPPATLIVDGEKARFEVVDQHTVRYSWSKPNPHFLPALADTSPLYIYRPAHYLKPFHKKYAKPDDLAKLVKQYGARKWSALHNKLDNQYRNDNPNLPQLDPWILVTKPPASRFEFVRNPYFHRVDTAGHQLPYIDRVVATVADGKIIPPKVGAGEADLQARGLQFNYYPFLKKNEKLQDYAVRLWQEAKGSHMAMYFNLNNNDPEFRKLFRDVRFRRAFSIAIDRHEINQAIYFGLALEGNNTVLPQSPLYKPEYRRAWAKFDLKQANRLLDEIGLTRRNSGGIRLMPSGRPLMLIIETAGEESEQADVMELLGDTLKAAGIKIHTRPMQREVFRNRVFAGETQVAIWAGYENGLAHAGWSPEEFAPTTQQQLQWPKWGQYVETNGKSGEPIDMPEAQELARLNQQWGETTDLGTRRAIWERMLQIHADNVFSVGIVAQVPQPVVVSNRLRNVPEKAVYNWMPGAFFGMYHPDTFWYADAPAHASAQ